MLIVLKGNFNLFYFTVSLIVLARTGGGQSSALLFCHEKGDEEKSEKVVKKSFNPSTDFRYYEGETTLSDQTFYVQSNSVTTTYSSLFSL